MNTLTNERLEEIIERRSPPLRWELAPAMAAELLSLRAQLATRIKRESAARKGFDEQLERANAAEAQLAELRGQEPIGAFHITDGEFEATSDYCARGEFPIQDGLLEVYARPAPQAVIQPVLSDVIEKFSEMNIGFPVQKLKADYVISWVLNNYPCDIKSQPYMVPDEMTVSDEMTVTAQMFAKGHNACRAAMIQYHSGDVGDKVNSPVIPDGSALVLIEPTYPDGLASLITEGMNEMVGRTIGGYSSDNGD